MKRTPSTGRLAGLVMIMAAISPLQAGAQEETAVWVNARGETVSIERYPDGSVGVRVDGGSLHTYGSDNQNWYTDFDLDEPGSQLVSEPPEAPEPRVDREPPEPRAPTEPREPVERPERPERPGRSDFSE